MTAVCFALQLPSCRFVRWWRWWMDTWWTTWWSFAISIAHIFRLSAYFELWKLCHLKAFSFALSTLALFAGNANSNNVGHFVQFFFFQYIFSPSSYTWWKKKVQWEVSTLGLSNGRQTCKPVSSFFLCERWCMTYHHLLCCVMVCANTQVDCSLDDCFHDCYWIRLF